MPAETSGVCVEKMGFEGAVRAYVMRPAITSTSTDPDADTSGTVQACKLVCTKIVSADIDGDCQVRQKLVIATIGLVISCVLFVAGCAVVALLLVLHV